MAEANKYCVALTTIKGFRYLRVTKEGQFLWEEHKASASSMTRYEAAALCLGLSLNAPTDSHWIEEH